MCPGSLDPETASHIEGVFEAGTQSLHAYTLFVWGEMFDLCFFFFIFLKK
jgi:hypothetical protein